MSNKTSDNNVGNDIEFLKSNKADALYFRGNPKLKSAIQNILAELEQKDKRIQELEEKLLDMIQGTEIINKETPEYVKENYIPKQAVIDKINEYDKRMEEDAGHLNWVITDRIVMNVLQELLEGRNENG